jgi:hypothetical protein
MKQNETRDTEIQLSPAQELALNALMAGSRVTDAAAAAGVNRSTLHRWMGEPAFLAAHNGRRLELAASASAKLLNLREKALGAVEQALDAGDARVAVAVLKGVGMLDGQSLYVGSDDPERVAQEIKAAQRQRERDEKQRELMDLLDF